MRSNFAQDYSVRKHSAPGSIGINEMVSVNSPLVVYPNPSKGSFSVSIKNLKGNVPLKIFNAIGELVYQTTLSADAQTINLTGHAKGIYFVKVYGAESVYTNKIIIE